MSGRELVARICSWLKIGGVPAWIAMIVGFYAFWPIGLAILLVKMDLLHPEKWFTAPVYQRYNTQPGLKTSEQRKKEYLNLSRNKTYVSIDNLASVVGVNPDITMRDVQEMIIENAFGPGAYIDYAYRRVVLNSAASAGAASSNTSSAGYTPKNVEVNKSGSTKPQTTAASQTSPTKQEKKAAEKAKREKRAKNAGEIFSSQSALLWVGIALLAVGGLAGLSAIDDIATWGFGAVTFFDMVFPIVMAITGGGMLGTRFLRKKRARRITNYLQIIGDRSSVSFSELASAVGESENTVKKDVEVMLEKKLLGDEAYMDVGAGKVIIFRTAEAEKPEEEDSQGRYSEIVKEIRQLNDEIADEMVSEKIDQIENLTKKIFQVVEDKPEKLPEIKSFMSYYLPTTLKLLRSYRDFEKQGVGGDNIDATKERIEKILDTLVSGFSQQLDQLFKSDAIDISSDIDVLETMMKRDGLQKDESGFGEVQAGV